MANFIKNRGIVCKVFSKIPERAHTGISIKKILKVLSASVVLLCFFNTNTYSQNENFFRRYLNNLIHDTSDISAPKFIAYPTLAYSPETSWEFGFSGLYVYYTNRDTANRLSEINGFAFLTLENQYGYWLDHALYTNKNEWFVLGRLRFQDFPLRYFGIGINSPSEYLAIVEASQINIRERVLRKIYKSLYFGFQADYQQLSFARFIPSPDVEFDNPPGSQGSSSIGLGLNLVYDNRHNILNVRDGLFSELAFIKYPAFLSNYSFTTIISDNRIYIPSGKNNVFATQVFGQFNMGNPPFNMLSLMGGESIMRGYYLGRFRDKNQIAAQVEYRFLPLPLNFTDRLGAAIFASAGTVFNEFESLNVSKFVVAGGGGIRFLLFPKRDIYTRLDIAFTKEGQGFYIYIGEAF